MSFPGPYRPVKVEYDSEDNWDSNQGTQGVNLTSNDMDVSQVQALIESALAQQERQFQAQLNTMNEHLQRISIEVPRVITYERITANPAIACDLSLDIINRYRNLVILRKNTCRGGRQPPTHMQFLDHIMEAMSIIKL